MSEKQKLPYSHKCSITFSIKFYTNDLLHGDVFILKSPAIWEI